MDTNLVESGQCKYVLLYKQRSKLYHQTCKGLCFWAPTSASEKLARFGPVDFSENEYLHWCRFNCFPHL